MAANSSNFKVRKACTSFTELGHLLISNWLEWDKEEEGFQTGHLVEKRSMEVRFKICFRKKK